MEHQCTRKERTSPSLFQGLPLTSTNITLTDEMPLRKGGGSPLPAEKEANGASSLLNHGQTLKFFLQFGFSSI